jgi:ABC-type microcin C transport system duplicated ATPase subunit YejF
VGEQIVEAIQTHFPSTPKRVALAQALDLLESTGIANAKSRIHAFPHEFSGGMKQRVMIAMALSCQPALLIADEPTTALDVTVQAQILQLLDRVVSERNLSVMLITHDLGVVAGFTQRTLVMYGARFDRPNFLRAGPPIFRRVGCISATSRLAKVAKIGRDSRPSAQPACPAARLLFQPSVRI